MSLAHVLRSRIYVAGHRGLVGSAFCRALERRGVRGIIRRPRRELDLSQGPVVERFFRTERPEVVFLAAGRAAGIRENIRHPADLLTENLSIALNVLTSAQRHGARRVIYFASSCIYPRAARQPLRECDVGTGAIEPTSRAYAAAKWTGLELCEALNRQHGGARFLPLIPNSVYGPGDDFNPQTSHVLSALIARFHAAAHRKTPFVTLWGSGRPRREFIHSDDLAEACLALLALPPARVPRPCNVGVGRDYAIREMAEVVSAAVGYRGKIRWDRAQPDGVARKLLDSSFLFSTGWRPKVSLEKGVTETYAWYVQHRSLAP